jgi:iron complex transport system permease protein
MLKKYVIWMMGSLVNVSKSQLEILILSVVFGLIISIFLTKKLNILLMGENYAKTIGVNVKRTQYLVFLSVSILAGTITAFCGPIGFIGIAVPHVARMFFNTSDHKHLIFGSAIIGAIVMLLSDIISQMPGSNSVLPINAVTSLIGIPIIIWIVVKNHKMSSSI